MKKKILPINILCTHNLVIDTHNLVIDTHNLVIDTHNLLMLYILNKSVKKI